MQGIVINGISKEFSGKFVLNDINLEIQQGTVHAIIGENGAGKSTLMNILSGVLKPTKGEFTVDGEKAVLSTPKDALSVGIGMVHQHFMLAPSLQVWQNVIMGIEPKKAFGYIDKKSALNNIKKVCETYSIDLNLEQVVGSMTVGEQQRIEILKVLVRDARYIILDEPTAVLTPQEIEQLFESVRSLKAMGKTIIFISHKLDEVMAVADRISVLRHGNLIGTINGSEANPELLVDMMVGREIHIDGEPLKVETGAPVIEVKDLCTPRSAFFSGLDKINLTVRAGEVLGIAGVDGNGQNDLIRAILGIERISSGSVIKDGENITKLSESAIRAKGISLIPPDRQKQGLVLDSSIIKNFVLGCENSPKICKHGLINLKKVREKAEELTEEYDVRLHSVDDNSGSLSGGNQQKIILAREFGIRTGNLVLAVNPTRGLDVGAIEFVYEQIEKQKKEGKAILLVSTELSEIRRLSDRIAVFYKGRVMGLLDSKNADIETIGKLMMGITD